MVWRLTCGANALPPERSSRHACPEVGFSQQLLDFGVLASQLSQSAGAGYAHAAKFGTPLVESGTTEAAFAAQLLDRHASLGLLYETDDLFFGESASLHS